MQRKEIFPRSLQYLLAIAENNSFTRAAEVLRVSQPTLSQQIKQLETTLQTTLLDRSGRKVRLTDAGETYLHHAIKAREMLDSGKRAINDVEDLSRGSLRVGWTPITDYLTCSLLEEFSSDYPGITLKTFEMPQDDIDLAVAEDKIDFGITFGKKIYNEAQASETKVETLFQDTLSLAVGDLHPLAKESKKVSIKSIEDEKLALLNSDFALRVMTDSYFYENKVEPKVAMEANSLNVIIQFIQGGTIATILPKTIVDSQVGLNPVILSPKLPTKAITLSYRKEGYTSPACRAFKDLASKWASPNNKIS
tara:strand:+ start:455 stop:1378 length:924 start_codon:yes stop_codon:yes gene_type:complete